MPFAFMCGKTYANTGDKQVWLKTFRPSDEKRFCTVHLTVFGDGKDRVKPLIIFRGTGKRINQREKDQYHHKVQVEFQKDAWMNEEKFRKYVVSLLARFKENGKLLLILDAHPSQRTAAMQMLLHSKNIYDVEVAKGCTGELQVLDVAVNKDFKAIVQEQYDQFLEQNIEEVSDSKISASEKRILVTRWVGSAWQRLHPLPNRICETVVKAFEYTGVTLPIDGSRDAEISIPGLEEYKIGKSLTEDLEENEVFKLVEEDDSEFDDSLGEITLDSSGDSDSGNSNEDEYVADSGDESGGGRYSNVSGCGRNESIIIRDASSSPGPSTSRGNSNGRKKKYRRVLMSDSSSDDEHHVPFLYKNQSGYGKYSA